MKYAEKREAIAELIAQKWLYASLEQLRGTIGEQSVLAQASAILKICQPDTDFPC